MPLNELTQAVRDELRSTSPRPPLSIDDRLDLRVDLGLTDDLKRSLARPFTDIASRFKEGAHISRDECGRLEKVKQAIELVAAKAGFEE